MPALTLLIGGSGQIRTADLTLIRGALYPTELQTQSSSSMNQAIRVGTYEEAESSIKEVIQPQVPLRLPCYDFTPVMNHTVVTVPPKVRLATSGATHSHGVTGGVYKARERIHRDILIRDY